MVLTEHTTTATKPGEAQCLRDAVASFGRDAIWGDLVAWSGSAEEFVENT